MWCLCCMAWKLLTRIQFNSTFNFCKAPLSKKLCNLYFFLISPSASNQIKGFLVKVLISLIASLIASFACLPEFNWHTIQVPTFDNRLMYTRTHTVDGWLWYQKNLCCKSTKPKMLVGVYTYKKIKIKFKKVKKIFSTSACFLIPELNLGSVTQVLKTMTSFTRHSIRSNSNCATIWSITSIFRSMPKWQLVRCSRATICLANTSGFHSFKSLSASITWFVSKTTL